MNLYIQNHMTKAMNLFYEKIQFNSSEISSNKYYRGPVNGDIYAKVDKRMLINQIYSKK